MIDTAYRVSPLRSTDPERLGGYLLVGRLGVGGMGVVYLAESEDGSYVAIKLIHPDLAADPEFGGRFRGEVERARQVPPFCTAEFLDADLDHDPPYLVVEYIDGPSLDEVVAERGPLRGGALHSLAVGVATALTGIHGAGIIHRDLKPGNVLLAPGSPKVIDFGIARPFEITNRHTRTDVLVGTVAYMAPERFSDQTDSPVTAAADVFAWGCVITFAGTGRTPFSGDSPAATAARILTQPPRLDGLPEALREPVRRALARDPADRPTAPDLLAMLLEHQPTSPPARPGRQPSPEPGRRSPAGTGRPDRAARRRRASLAALALLPLVAGVTVAVLATNGEDDPGPGAAPPVASAGPSLPVGVTPTPSSGARRTPRPTPSSPAGQPGRPATTSADPAPSPTTSPARTQASANPSGRNLALGRPARASSEEGGARIASYAVDGDPESRWGSQFSDPQWLSVDLGGLWRISEVVLRWQRSHAATYRVDVSPDGQRWTTVYETSTGEGGVVHVATGDVAGRYVRMYGTRRGGSYGYSLWELEVR
ncbi:protein kinase [Micromonospora sp. WMMD882]|uniref:serine/threonine protein kinase n=1 Tax=Micromonospora sp. WMMD882 TaxID=3015151 RepID=UPI00248CF0DE|nr:protein kinase [Micromonospora sp. WMMD882]WBB80465.1 protein kinase [Micromonospora sp. WMMD882]